MTQTERSALTSAALDYDTTIIGALELSESKWVLAVQLPGENHLQTGRAIRFKSDGGFHVLA